MLPDWIIRLRSWEYWPLWVLYIPVALTHVKCTFKTGSPFFFLNVNPEIDKGFILSDSKLAAIQKLPPSMVPKTVLIPPGTSIKKVSMLASEQGLNFPLIMKPEIGYRGLKVSLVRNSEDLEVLLRGVKVNFLLQEYIQYPVEIGVFWYRLPNEGKGVIPSLTLKEFLRVEGDGVTSLEMLIKRNPRWKLQAERLKNENTADWTRVLPKGELRLLEPVGNHNRGTTFLNGNHLIDDSLLHRIEEICDLIPGFNFGRLDIKVKSLEDFKNGGEVRVIEVNGIGAEPTHVYQPGYSLWRAWREMSSLWLMAAEIANANKRKGYEFPVFSEAKARYLQYLRYKRKAFKAN